MKLYLTDKGREILYKAQGGQQLNFSKFVVGDGELGSQAIQRLTNLINPKMNLNISKINVKTDKVVVGTFLTNSDLEEGFYFRELGLYANDPDTQEEILYMYANAGKTAEYIDSKEENIIEEYLDINIVVSNARNVTATIDESLVYVTDKEFKEHTDAKNKHLTDEEKEAIQDLQPVSEELLTSVGAGVSGTIIPNTEIFNVTKEMVGKRILCDTTHGRRINLPSPQEAGKGAVIEIQGNASSSGSFIDVFTPSGSIYKSEMPISAFVFQPQKTTRRYISSGINWHTNAEKVAGVTTLYVDIDAENGSDTELVYNGKRRKFKSFSMIENLKEYEDIHVRLFGENILDKVIHLRNMTLNLYSGTLILPSDKYIRIEDVTLRLNQIIIKTDGKAFECGGSVTAILGGHESMTIRPYTDADFSLLSSDTIYWENNAHETNTLLAISMCRCYLKTDNIENFSHKGRLISWGDIYGPPPIFISQNAYCGWGSKAENVYWHNSSDTLSRIGTSSVYTIG